MWILLNDAFISITTADDMPEHVCVRARRPEDLRLFNGYGDVISTPDRDYECRMILSREVVSDVIAHEIDNINYDNFKESIPMNPVGDARYEIYGRVWGALLEVARI